MLCLGLSQIREYFTQFISLREGCSCAADAAHGAGVHDGAIIAPTRLRDKGIVDRTLELLIDVMDLARNPLMLSMLASVLPTLQPGHVSRLTRYSLYRLFLTDSMSRELLRLCRQDKGRAPALLAQQHDEVPSSTCPFCGDAVTDKSDNQPLMKEFPRGLLCGVPCPACICRFELLCALLAGLMLKAGVELAHASRVESMTSAVHWDDFLDKADEWLVSTEVAAAKAAVTAKATARAELPRRRELENAEAIARLLANNTITSFLRVCPVVSTEGSVCFRHRSFFEYFCSRHLLLSTGVGTPIGIRVRRAEDVLSLHGRRVQSEPGVLDFLRDAWRESQAADSRECLFELISLSSTSVGTEHGAAANAATILNWVGVQLNRRKWDRVVLSGADLTRAILTGTSLVEAQLIGCRFEKAILRDVDMRGADLTGVDFAELPPIHTAQPISGIAWHASQPKVIRMISDDGEVKCWSTESAAPLSERTVFVPAAKTVLACGMVSPPVGFTSDSAASDLLVAQGVISHASFTQAAVCAGPGGVGVACVTGDEKGCVQLCYVGFEQAWKDVVVVSSGPAISSLACCWVEHALVAVGTEDGRVAVFRVSESKLQALCQPLQLSSGPTIATSLAFGHVGALELLLLGVGCSDGALLLVDACTLAPARETLHCGDRAVTCVLFLSVGPEAVVACCVRGCNVVRLLSLRSAREAGPSECPLFTTATGGTLVDGGALFLAAGAQDGRVFFFDAASGRPASTACAIAHCSPVTALALFQSGWFASGASDGSVWLAVFESNGTLKDSCSLPPLLFSSTASSVATLSSGEDPCELVVTYENGTKCVWRGALSTEQQEASSSFVKCGGLSWLMSTAHYPVVAELIGDQVAVDTAMPLSASSVAFSTPIIPAQECQVLLEEQACPQTVDRVGDTTGFEVAPVPSPGTILMGVDVPGLDAPGAVVFDHRSGSLQMYANRQQVWVMQAPRQELDASGLRLVGWNDSRQVYLKAVLSQRSAALLAHAGCSDAHFMTTSSSTCETSVGALDPRVRLVVVAVPRVRGISPSLRLFLFVVVFVRHLHFALA